MLKLDVLLEKHVRMKHHKLFLLSLLFSFSALFFTNTFAAKYTTISIKDFGAKGDGKTNDHLAFQKASKYIQQHPQDILLIIPFGKYIIGQQQLGINYYLEGDDIFNLDHVKNIRIEGQTKNGKYPILKYKDGLSFGTFITDGPQTGKPMCEPKKSNYAKKNAAFIGSCFRINRSENITVSNLEIDGNQDKMKIGGFFGDVGRQLNHRGFYILYSNHITLKNIFTHHLGLDGVEIAVSNNTQIDNLISEYNGRQGLSWTGGDSLEITNSKLRYTGCSRIKSAPAAGMDIEPEGKNDLHYGRFTNCEFAFNQGCGVVNDHQKNKAHNLLFTKCTFIGYYNWAIWVTGPKTRFENCNIYGQIAHAIKASDTKSKEDFTTFYKCKFNNVYKNQFTNKQSNFLIELNEERILIDNCTVYAQNIGALYHGNHNQSAAPSIIQNSTVIIDNTFNSQIATEGVSIYASNFCWVDKISSNLNLIKNENNQFKKLPKAQVSSLIPASEKGIKPFITDIRNFDCASGK